MIVIVSLEIVQCVATMQKLDEIKNIIASNDAAAIQCKKICIFDLLLVDMPSSNRVTSEF